MTELPTTFFERRAARGRRSIFDFDDAIFETRRRPGKFRRLVGLADPGGGGQPLPGGGGRAPEKTVVIPTASTPIASSRSPTRPARGRDVVVGWTGLSGNYRQLAHAAAGIARALERTGARFLHHLRPSAAAVLACPPPRVVRWRPETEVEDLARIDIGVMPLPDGPYERGKCAFKLLQYMALGRPGVASPVGANSDVVTPGADGFLPDHQDGWDEVLTRLGSRSLLRREMGPGLAPPSSAGIRWPSWPTSTRASSPT